MRARFARSIDCIYVDPPYNTGSDGFLYKDSYLHSSWLSMMQDRLLGMHRLLRDGGSFFSSIDDNEDHHLRSLLDAAFGVENYVDKFVWVRTRTPAALARKSKTVAEFVYAYEKQLSNQPYFGVAKPVLSSNPLTIETNRETELVFPEGTEVGVADGRVAAGEAGTPKT
jgi:adenine-specific DNA-methyltransferase